MPQTKKKTKTKTIRLIGDRVEQDYRNLLERLTDEIFEAATYTHDWTWWQLSKESKCSYGTVVKLGNRKSNPMLRTIQKLAKSVGLGVRLEQANFQFNKTRELKKRKAG